MPILAALMAFGADACAHDIPGWKVATSEHFRVYTDQRPHSFDAVLDRLEEVHFGLSHSLFGNATIPVTEVFLFSPTEFRELLGPIGGMAVRGIGNGTTLVVYDGWDPHFLEQTAAHELTHAFIGATFKAPPVWFNEGFATYAESIMVQSSAVFFGSSHVHVDTDAASGRLVSVMELFGAPWKSFHGDWESRQYATAWAVVHYLWHGENKSLRTRFDTFGAALSAEGGKPGGTLRAWHTVYPEIPIDTIDSRLRGHMIEAFNRGRDSVVGFHVNHPDRPPTVLTPADMAFIDTVREQLRHYRREDKL